MSSNWANTKPHIATALTMLATKRNLILQKRGPSLESKAKELGIRGNIPTLLVYQDTSSLWHVIQHCPEGVTLPDLNAMVGIQSSFQTVHTSIHS